MTRANAHAKKREKGGVQNRAQAGEPEPYDEPGFVFSGEGECSQSAALGFMGSWPHPQARPWGSGAWRAEAVPGKKSGLRHPATAIPCARPLLPWNQVNDFQSRAARAKLRLEKQQRESVAIRNGALVRTLWPRPWLERSRSRAASAQLVHTPQRTPCHTMPFVGEGFSRSLQRAKHTYGYSVKEVLGPHTVIVSPSVAHRLITDRNSTLFDPSKTVQDMCSFEIRGSPATPRLKVARDEVVNLPPRTDVLQPIYTPLGAPQPTILGPREELSTRDPPRMKGTGIFRDFRIRREKFAPTPAQLMQCIKEAATMAAQDSQPAAESHEAAHDNAVSPELDTSES